MKQTKINKKQKKDLFDKIISLLLPTSKKFAYLAIALLIFSSVMASTPDFSQGFKIQDDNEQNVFLVNKQGDVNFTGGLYSHDYLFFDDDVNISGFLNVTGQSYFGGNVGIGTTSPLALIHLNYDAADTAQFVIQTPRALLDEAFVIGHSEAGYTTSFIGNSFNNNAARLDVRMKGITSSNAVMTFLGSGNVGIGTASPSGRLHVDGGNAHTTINFTTGTSAGWDIFQYLTGGDTGASAILYLGYAGDPDNFSISRGSDAKFHIAAGGANKVTVLGDGNVGIGTTSPTQAKLVVNTGLTDSGRVGFFDTALDANSEYAYLQIGNNATGGALDKSAIFGYVHSANNDLKAAYMGVPGLNPATGQGLYVVRGGDGNVGIGTTSPGRLLEISGADAKILVQGSTASSIMLEDNGFANDPTFEWQSISGRMRLNYIDDVPTSTGDLISVLSNGNVGIGTASPTNGKLTITNPDTATNYWGIWIEGTEIYGIGLGTSADNNCYENSAAAGCSLNDYAEMMEFSELPEDSDVIVIDTENAGELKVSTKPYDKLVAGIASEEPAMVIGSYGITIKGWDKGNITRDGYYTYPLAISGRKLIKVTDENGEVMPGDFLVSSSERGKAMRCDIYEKCQGAILGKAMTSVRENGKVLALITLQ